MQFEIALFSAAMVAVSAGCLVPARWLPPLPNDKALHFLAFAGLSLLAARIAVDGQTFACYLAGLLVAGWLIECVQNAIPGRSFCWRDLAANAAGIGSAGLCVLLVQSFPSV
jgi:VanZ family protein